MKRQINPLTLAQIVLLIVIVLIWGLAIWHRNRPIETRSNEPDSAGWFENHSEIPKDNLENNK